MLHTKLFIITILVSRLDVFAVKKFFWFKEGLFSLHYSMNRVCMVFSVDCDFFTCKVSEIVNCLQHYISSKTVFAYIYCLLHTSTLLFRWFIFMWCSLSVSFVFSAYWLSLSRFLQSMQHHRRSVAFVKAIRLSLFLHFFLFRFFRRFSTYKLNTFNYILSDFIFHLVITLFAFITVNSLIHRIYMILLSL